MSSSAFAPGPNSATQPRLRARRARVPAAIAGATPPAPPRGLGIGDRPFLGLPRRRAARHVRVERCAKCDALGKSLGSNMRECYRRAAGLAEAPSRARAALGAAAVGGVATAAYAAYGGFGNGNGGAGGKGFGGGGNGGGGGGEGGRARGQRRSSQMGASAGGAAAASASPGQEGEGESSIMHVGLPSPTKLASKHFRRSPNANSTSTFGPYDA